MPSPEIPMLTLEPVTEEQKLEFKLPKARKTKENDPFKSMSDVNKSVAIIMKLMHAFGDHSDCMKWHDTAELI